MDNDTVERVFVVAVIDVVGEGIWTATEEGFPYLYESIDEEPIEFNGTSGKAYFFTNMEDAMEARRAIWAFLERNSLHGIVDLAVETKGGEEDVDTTTEITDRFEDEMSIKLADQAIAGATGCLDVALNGLLKAALVGLETPLPVFVQAVNDLLAAEEGNEEDDDTPPVLN